MREADVLTADNGGDYIVARSIDDVQWAGILAERIVW
jgi:hypothetical protein